MAQHDIKWRRGYLSDLIHGCLFAAMGLSTLGRGSHSHENGRIPGSEVGLRSRAHLLAWTLTSTSGPQAA